MMIFDIYTLSHGAVNSGCILTNHYDDAMFIVINAPDFAGHLIVLFKSVSKPTAQKPPTLWITPILWSETTG